MFPLARGWNANNRRRTLLLTASFAGSKGSIAGIRVKKIRIRPLYNHFCSSIWMLEHGIREAKWCIIPMRSARTDTSSKVGMATGISRPPANWRLQSQRAFAITCPQRQ
jgi:hypothetical protein